MNDQMNDQGLKARENAARNRLERELPAMQARASDSYPEWLRSMIQNPPPLLSEEEVAELERSEREQEIPQLLLRLPEAFRSPLPQLLKRDISRKLREAALKWRPIDGPALLLGEMNQGKSTAAAIMVQRVIYGGARHGGRAWEMAQGFRWYRSQELERAALRHPFGASDAEEVRHAMAAPLLVIDDVGWEKDWTLLGDVASARWQRHLVTIWTSGRDLGDLPQPGGGTFPGLMPRYGDAMLKRLMTTNGRGGLFVRDFPAADVLVAEARRKARELAGGGPVAFNETAERE